MVLSIFLDKQLSRDVARGQYGVLVDGGEVDYADNCFFLWLRFKLSRAAFLELESGA